jgi:hypothetical protein
MPEQREFWALFARRVNEALRASRDDGIRFLWVDDIVLAEIPPAGAPTAISSTA